MKIERFKTCPLLADMFVAERLLYAITKITPANNYVADVLDQYGVWCLNEMICLESCKMHMLAVSFITVFYFDFE